MLNGPGTSLAAYCGVVIRLYSFGILTEGHDHPLPFSDYLLML